MISSKGILYTMLAAGSVAIITGTLLTRKAGSENSAVGRLRTFFGSLKKPRTARQQKHDTSIAATATDISGVGHS